MSRHLFDGGPAGDRRRRHVCDHVFDRRVQAEEAPLDRLFHVIDGTLEIQDTELFRGLALDDGTGSKQTDAEGGGVLVNPGATLNVTSCMFKSNAASGTATSDRDGGHNAAGGGIYAAAGSSLNITGLTSFVNNRLIAGHGASAVGTGGDGVAQFGAGVAMNAPVSGESNTTGSAGELTLTSNDTGAAQIHGGPNQHRDSRDWSRQDRGRHRRNRIANRRSRRKCLRRRSLYRSRHDSDASTTRSLHQRCREH